MDDLSDRQFQKKLAFNIPGMSHIYTGRIDVS